MHFDHTSSDGWFKACVVCRTTELSMNRVNKTASVKIQQLIVTVCVTPPV